MVDSVKRTRADSEELRSFVFSSPFPESGGPRGYIGIPVFAPRGALQDEMALATWKESVLGPPKALLEAMVLRIKRPACR